MQFKETYTFIRDDVDFHGMRVVIHCHVKQFDTREIELKRQGTNVKGTKEFLAKFRVFPGLFLDFDLTCDFSYYLFFYTGQLQAFR